MWKPFIDSENLYMLRLEQAENELTLSLTDFLSIWESQFSIEILVLNFKENNPLIAADDGQIKSDLLEILDNLQSVKVHIHNLHDNVLELNLEQNCSNLSKYVMSQNIVYRFRLNKKDQDEFKNKITVSAIQTIYFLEKQQQMLLNLVQKKDRELEEYRMEKGDISRGDLKTDKFNPELINTNNEKLFLNIFTKKDGVDFWKKLTEKNGEVQPAVLSVETEPWNVRKRKKVIHSSENVVKKGVGVRYKK